MAVAYNTMATPGSCLKVGAYPAGCSVNYEIACKTGPPPNAQTKFSAYGNYVDWSGATAAFLEEEGCSDSVWGKPVDNIDLKTGKPLLPRIKTPIQRPTKLN